MQSITELVEEFRTAWLEGEKPSLAHYLRSVNDQHRPALLNELIPIDIERRICAGDTVLPDDYLLFGFDAVDFAEKSFHRVNKKHYSADAYVTIPNSNYRPCPTNESFLKHNELQATTLDRYELLNVAGRGGFATVFRARIRESDEVVAVKILHTRHWTSPNSLKRFFREGEALRNFKYPRVCQILDSGLCNGVPFIAMEFIDGETLNQILRKRERIPLRQALLAVYKLAGTLAEAHRQGIVHRDLKPSNIMFEPKNGGLRILDFGLAFYKTDDQSRLT